MKITVTIITIFIILIFTSCGENQPTRTTKIKGFSKLTEQQKSVLLTGKRSYEQYCSGCHGVNGDSKGSASELLITKPRDFTKGVYKFKITPSGSLPINEDLYRTISNGVARTSMPAWPLIPENERRALVEYIKTFSDRWQSQGPGNPITIPEPPEFLGTVESITKGKTIYQNMQCGKCHGEKGRGDGLAAETLTDDFGDLIKPFDFTLGVLKGGPTVKDIYRTFTTGLDGTPMPAYGDILKEEDRWHLVSYVLYLMNKTSVTENEISQIN
jgi:cytochrome c oxidase cbb3-type subunit 2